jgi:hypothetical protein
MRKVIKRIHVNRHNVAHNKKHNTSRPVFSVKTSKANHTTDHVEFSGSARLVYCPEKPLSCGAVVWIETSEPVSIDLDNPTIL